MCEYCMMDKIIETQRLLTRGEVASCKEIMGNIEGDIFRAGQWTRAVHGHAGIVSPNWTTTAITVSARSHA